jgi:hypothetical protein
LEKHQAGQEAGGTRPHHLLAAPPPEKPKPKPRGNGTVRRAVSVVM